MEKLNKRTISKNFFILFLHIIVLTFFCLNIYFLNYYRLSFEETKISKEIDYSYGKFYSIIKSSFSVKGNSVCRSFNNQNEVYYLEGDIEADSNCFYINNKNITFDCQGKKIRYNGGGFLFLSFYPETKIANCVIEGDFSSYSSGIFYFENSNNSALINNSIDINSNGVTIFKFKRSSSINLSENYITISGSNGYVFNLFDGSSRISLSKNVIEAYGGEQTIGYFENSKNITFFNSTLFMNSDNSIVFSIDYSDNLVFYENYIQVTGINSGVLESSYSKNLAFKGNNLVLSKYSRPFMYYYGENFSIIHNLIEWSGEGVFFDFFSSKNLNFSYNYVNFNSTNKTFLKIYEEENSLSSNAISYNIFNFSNGINDTLIRANNSNISFFENELYFTNETAYFLFEESNIVNFIKNNCTNLSFIFLNNNNHLMVQESCSYYLFNSNYECNKISVRETSDKKFLIEEDFKGNIFFYKNISISLLKDNKPMPNLFFCLYFFNKSLVFCNKTNDYGNSYFWLNNKIITNNIVDYLDFFYLSFNESGKDNSFPINITQYNSFTFNVPTSTERSSGSSYTQKIPISPITCKEDLHCEEWSLCLEGKSKRHCKDRNNCTGDFFEERNCFVKSINLIESKNLFDIVLKIFNKRLKKGEELVFSVSLLNIGSPGKVFGNLTYFIYDLKNNLVYEESEIIPVETQTELIKEINLKNFTYGKYILVVNLTYEGQKDPAFSSETFEIVSENYFFFITFILLLTLVLYPIIKLFLKQ